MPVISMSILRKSILGQCFQAYFLFCLLLSSGYLVLCWSFDKTRAEALQGDRYGSILILIHVAIHFDKYHLMAILSFLPCVFDFFEKNQGSACVGNYIWFFPSILLIIVSDFRPKPCCFFYNSSVVQQIVAVVCFYMKFKLSFFFIVNSIGIVIRVVLIYTLLLVGWLFLQYQSWWQSHHLVSSSNSKFNVLKI